MNDTGVDMTAIHCHMNLVLMLPCKISVFVTLIVFFFQFLVAPREVLIIGSFGCMKQSFNSL